MALFIILVTLAYLMGSISSAVIVCKVFALPDPRLEGSKNPGATNVLRLAGKHFAALVLVSDLLKGAIPVIIAKLLGAGAITIGFTALAAVIGHMYPIFFGFKGGKGVATALGAMLGIQIIAGTIVVAVWLLIAKFSRYSSLASILSIIIAPLVVVVVTANINLFPPLAIITLLVLFKHRDNISRLLDGAEPKITFDHHSKHGVLEDVLVVPPEDGHEIEEPIITTTVVKEKAAKPAAKKDTASKATKPKAKKPADAAKKTTKPKKEKKD